MNDVILLAEGEARHAVTVLASFNSNGLTSEVHLAGDGHETLDFLFSQRAIEKRGDGQLVLILLDLGLPITGGLDILRAVKRDHRTANIPVVVLANSASDLDIHTAMKFGADSVVEKPLTFHKLVPVARRLGVQLGCETFPAQSLARPADPRICDDQLK
jgi:CheY-like chemotaxis protein